MSSSTGLTRFNQGILDWTASKKRRGMATSTGDRPDYGAGVDL
ncbi:hypothetical protein [Oscillatoria sp. FACHB-1407]|nr:hypothetical protein [Oscillatoria sp. FACHB-1407]